MKLSNHSNTGETSSLIPCLAARGSTRDVRPEPEFDHFARLAASVCSTPMAAVTLMDDGMQWMKGKVGLSCDLMPADQSFCIHTVAARTFMDVRDASDDERFRRNPLVTGTDHIRFYAGEPLLVDGEAVGALCVLDTELRPAGLDPGQRRALFMLAAQASLQIQLRQAVVERDNTAEELNAAIRQLRWAATHDHLTGLGNRALLRQILDDLSVEDAAPFALLAIDVDHFKQVNDSFGHHAGDALLQEIASRLSATVRTCDLIIRLGGDEFAVVLRNVTNDPWLRRLSGRLLEAMRGPFLHEGRMIECRITVGGARFPEHSSDVSDIVRYADAALYEGKARGRGVFVLFQAGLLTEQSRRNAEVARARMALAHGHIVPFYQPKVDLADGTILGLEALLRVVQPGRSPSLPTSIAAAFDEAELAQAIGTCLLDQVLADLHNWLRDGLAVGRVAVNVSATEIGDPGFSRRFLSALARHEIPPDNIEIEILENVLLDQRSSAVLTCVKRLSQAGVRIAFDDFGTGYAALAHLPKFPVNAIKIDQSFIRNLALPANKAIVRALVSLADELGLEAIAEGVETARQTVDLLALGCTIGQGYRYSEAVSAMNVTRLLRSSRQTPSGTGPIFVNGKLWVQRKAA